MIATTEKDAPWPQVSDDLHPDLRCCNCADCGRELLSWESVGLRDTLPAEDRDRCPPFVHERSGGRPYCLGCAEYRRRRFWAPYRGVRRLPGDENPGFDDVVRAAEEDR